MLDVIVLSFLFALSEKLRASQGKPQLLFDATDHGIDKLDVERLKQIVLSACEVSKPTFTEISSLMTNIADTVIEKNLNEQSIFAEVYSRILGMSQKPEDGSVLDLYSSIPTYAPTSINKPHMTEIARLWKAAIHGRDEKCSATYFLEYELLNSVYQELYKNFSMPQLRALRKHYAKWRTGVEWGEISERIKREQFDPIPSHFVEYFENMAKVLFRKRVILESDFRTLGKRRKGILYPYVKENQRALKYQEYKQLLAQQGFIGPELPPMTREQRHKRMRELGWKENSEGVLKHPIYFKLKTFE